MANGEFPTQQKRVKSDGTLPITSTGKVQGHQWILLATQQLSLGNQELHLKVG